MRQGEMADGLYGYRDNDDFFLKIKAAFPGKAR
ncbi:transposase [Lelliottia jeotgali]|jgi:hypothetical protein|nr:transposase [Lelliottia jeotgali]